MSGEWVRATPDGMVACRSASSRGPAGKSWFFAQFVACPKYPRPHKASKCAFSSYLTSVTSSGPNLFFSVWGARCSRCKVQGGARQGVGTNTAPHKKIFWGHKSPFHIYMAYIEFLVHIGITIILPHSTITPADLWTECVDDRKVVLLDASVSAKHIFTHTGHKHTKRC